MAIYVKENNKVVDIFANVDGDKKKIKSVWVNKDGVPTKVFPSLKSNVKIVSWAEGTDEELSVMLDAHYAGEINIYDYWHVGDERTVHLSAMTGFVNHGTGYVSENHPGQDATFVLMHSGGFKLSSAINDQTYCTFVVGQKNALKTKGKLHSYATGIPSNVHPTHRVYWFKDIYEKSLPSTFVPLFKKVIIYGAMLEGDKQGMYQNASFNFVLPSEFNIYGTITNSSKLEESYQFQFDYYKNSENILKKLGNDGIYTEYWTGSVSYDSNKYMNGACTVTSYGTSSHRSPNNIECGIAPFGCI